LRALKQTCLLLVLAETSKAFSGLGLGNTGEYPRKDWRGNSCCLHPSLGIAAQRSSKDQMAWLHFRPCLVRLGVEPELLDITVETEVFRVLLELLPCDPPRGKAEMKINKGNFYVSK